MTDDIVTRLREETCHMPECCWLFADAADEIERLRAELEYVRDVELGECRSEYTKISNKYYRLLKEQ
jgi:hypothetical protein